MERIKINENIIEDFNERCAVFEYDGNFTRTQAAFKALELIEIRYKRKFTFQELNYDSAIIERERP